MLITLFQLQAQNIPDYRADLDRIHNITWSDRPIWSSVTPEQVIVYYADIPAHLKSQVHNQWINQELYLPEFVKVSNRIFWVEDLRILYGNEDAARKYKKIIKQFKKYLNRFGIPINSELRGIPLTSHSTLKLFHPSRPKDFVFFKLIGSKESLYVSQNLYRLSKIGAALAFYPEVYLKTVSFSNLKHPRNNKLIEFPAQIFRSSEVVSEHNYKDNYAISLHSVLSDKTLLRKVSEKSGYKNIKDWYLYEYSKELAKFFHDIYYTLGILPGAHTQNIVAIISKDYKLKKLVWRDLGDLSYNPIVTLSNIGFSFVSSQLHQVNKTGGEGVPLVRLPVWGPILYTTNSTKTFADYFSKLFGQVFNVQFDGEMNIFDRNRIVYNFFNSLLDFKFKPEEYSSVLEEIRSHVTKSVDVISYSKLAGSIYNDFLTQYITRNFPINRYTTNYSKLSLAKAFIDGLKNNLVGFYDNYPEQWTKWQEKEKYQHILEAMLSNKNYQFVSNGLDLLLLRDIAQSKWVALSFSKHAPIPFDYLKHQKLLKVNVDYSYLRSHNFSCKILFY